MLCHFTRWHRARPDTNRLPSNRPESQRAKDVGLDMSSREAHREGPRSARSADCGNPAAPGPLASPRFPRAPSCEPADFSDTASAPLDDVSATQRNEAADVLAAVADLISAAAPEAAEPGKTFAGLARKLEELETRLQHIGRTDDAVAVKRALDQMEAHLRHPDSVETGASDPDQPTATSDFLPASPVGIQARGTPSEPDAAGGGTSPGIGRARHPAIRPQEIEIDAAIRDLTIRMAAVHREALRRGAWTARGGESHGTVQRIPVEFAGDALQPGLEIGAGDGSGAPTVQDSTLLDPWEPGAGLAGLLRRLELKVDALSRKADAGPAAADRHQADLLARRIESTELQLAKRLDVGFAASAVEARVLEDMLRALAARCDAQGDLGRTLATIEQSAGAIRDHLDRLEERLASPLPAPHAGEAGHDSSASGTEDAGRQPGPGSIELSLPPPAREEADSKVGAALDAIRDAVANMAERLRIIETQLSNAPRGSAGPSSWEREPSPALFWSEARAKLDGHDAEKSHAASPGSAFAPNDGKACYVASNPDTATDVPIEPGSGFTPPLESQDTHATRGPGLDGDEGGGGRTDFIEAACRAARAGQSAREPRPAEHAPAPPEPREGLGAKARRLAQAVRRSIFSS